MREPLTNGHVIGATRDRDEPWDTPFTPGTVRRKLIEVDWDGNTVWTYTPKDIPHHDYCVMASGNILAICRETVPERYKSNMADEERRNSTIYSDYLIEVTREGEIVWEWHEYEHLDINRYCPICHVEDWTHTNTVQELPETTLGTANPRFRAGNILINPRNHNTFYIIDKETEDVVWSWGRGILNHSHQVTMLHSGNIILFNNGTHSAPSGHSQVIEMNPVTGEIVWLYENGPYFYSPRGSGVQRLPNGNTLVCSANTARLFELTPEKKIVWEFVCPDAEKVYRAFRLPYNYCPQFAALPKPKEAAIIPGVTYTIKCDITLPGDINEDNVVNDSDLAQLVASYAPGIGDPRYEAKSDLNQDGVVDYLDLAILGANYGREAGD